MKCGFSVKTKISNNQPLTVQDTKIKLLAKLNVLFHSKLNRIVLEIETTKG